LLAEDCWLLAAATGYWWLGCWLLASSFQVLAAQSASCWLLAGACWLLLLPTCCWLLPDGCRLQASGWWLEGPCVVGGWWLAVRWLLAGGC
jgi:hypothetical protein